MVDTRNMNYSSNDRCNKQGWTLTFPMLLCWLCMIFLGSVVVVVDAWIMQPTFSSRSTGVVESFSLQKYSSNAHCYNDQKRASLLLKPLFAESSSASQLSTTNSTDSTTNTAVVNKEQQNDKGEIWDYQVPDDAVVTIRPQAMRRLKELRQQQIRKNGDSEKMLTLRMGVRSGGCSGMSYVMDLVDKDDVQSEMQEDDALDVYPDCHVQCIVDAKSLLYLYGMELDYSDALVGGGFKFINPNAEETCGCGSSFGV